MILREIELNDYLFGIDVADISSAKQKTIYRKLQQEMLEIFYGQNIPK